MILGIPAIIEYLSDFMTLSPGDLILTGTPKGVRYLKPSDVIISEIDEIGSLVNTIVEEPEIRKQEHVKSHVSAS
jgi:5-oxopent-3-ene-1,2,5-tricarboxylate decarboxylase/2-hydroxyhepta-2,4-diene-1,7-dioate isomerase